MATKTKSETPEIQDQNPDLLKSILDQQRKTNELLELLASVEINKLPAGQVQRDADGFLKRIMEQA